MGKALVRCLAGFPDLTLSAAAECEGHAAVGQDPGIVAGISKTEVIIGDDAAAAIKDADVAVDFTFHTAVPRNVNAAAAGGTALVIGTTGLDEAEAQAVKDAATSIAIVHAPNMSLGVNLLFALAEQAARALGTDYDIEIVETHHRHKKDAPSGTALRLGEGVARGREQNFEDVVVHGRQGQTGERPADQIGVHAVRAGAVVGDHTVLFASEGERIELTHRAISRDTFALGALRAVQWVANRPAGLYDMKDVLGL